MSLSAGSTHASFEYSDLPDASTHIRLLEVQHAQLNGPISCRLSTWELSKAPAYNAISYTWGHPADTTEIDVNGARIKVRSNCAYVLCQAGWHSAGHYWIDAICINQANSSEKSQQVRMMSEIYRNAGQVLACVGRHSMREDSEYLCTFLRKHQTALVGFANHIHRHVTLQFGEFGPHSYGHRTLRLYQSISWRTRHSLRTHTRVLKAMFSILRRPYFIRAWVAQELRAATEPLLYCGKDKCQVTALEGLLAISLHNDLDTRVRVPDLHSVLRDAVASHHSWLPMLTHILHSSVTTCKLEKEAAGLSAFAGLLRLARNNSRQPQGLVEMMLNMVSLQCTDPRDKVYAMLSSLAANVAQRLPVDYTITTFELAIRLIHVFYFEQPTGSGRPHMINMVLSLKALEVRLTDSAFVAAITARSGDRTSEATCWPSAASSKTSVRMPGWAGVQIQHTENGWSLLEHDSVPKAVSGSEMPRANGTSIVRVKDAEDRSVAIVPGGVQPGDWLVQLYSLIVSDCPGILLRPSADGFMQIIGTAISTKTLPIYARTAEFDVYFDPEDLSTMLYLHNLLFVALQPTVELSVPSSESHDTEDTTVHQLGLLNEDNRSQFRSLPAYYSSEERAFTPRVKQLLSCNPWPSPFAARIEAPFEQYFGIKVCCQPWSSHAVRSSKTIGAGVAR